MARTERIRVAVSGYWVISKRVADAVAKQRYMQWVGEARSSIAKTDATLWIGTLLG